MIFAPGIRDHVQDVDGVSSTCFSMSFSASQPFGDRVDDFTDEVRELRRERSPDGAVWDWPSDIEVMLVRK